MADNYAKLWVQKSSNQLAINRAQQAISNTGRALPCRVVSVSGSIVTVAFEVSAAPLTLPNITIPKAESPWIRMPTQVGDKGVTMPADAYLGGVSGLGGGVANLTRPGNLSALVFVPISNAGSGPIDQNAAQVQGPNGAIIRTTQGTRSEIVTNTDGTTVTFGTSTIVVNGTETALTFGATSLVLNAAGITMTFGANTIVLNGSGLSINGESYENHTHGYFPGTGTKVQTDPPIN
ncbi:hypothetical protein BGLT_02265 [Caballeronia glathei]|uniref:Phage baseplate protein n=1 Tax=Caballeronia glathei TaxID=60547 RepID=A0A069PM83_9BURK|nr:hypothetical protein [Caballeronia glathei]KDR41537.1 hypothetical protein BG61_16705 [Caballeronia glathei]CDY79484.1 hypothetical protein BGLT_02265 [Caballeronia glathei]